MQPSDWISSGIALGALAVAILALASSAKSAKAAQASARASEASAQVSARQHAHELARDGIVEFGPWRAEAFSGGVDELPFWRFINVGDQTLHDLAVQDFGRPWQLVKGEKVEPGEFATGTLPAGYNTYSFPSPVKVSWREDCAEAPLTASIVWMHRPDRRGLGN